MMLPLEFLVILHLFFQFTLLDLNTFDLSTPEWLTGIGTIVAAFIAVGALVVTLRQDKAARYLEFLKDVDFELSDHLEKEKNLEDLEQCLVYCYNYISICERILFLVYRKKIPKDFVDYYKEFFNYSLTMMWWYKSAYDDEHSPTESWPSLTSWILTKEMNPYPFAHLPKQMREELAMKDEKLTKISKGEIFDDLTKYLKKWKIKKEHEKNKNV